MGKEARINRVLKPEEMLIDFESSYTVGDFRFRAFWGECFLEGSPISGFYRKLLEETKNLPPNAIIRFACDESGTPFALDADIPEARNSG